MSYFHLFFKIKGKYVLFYHIFWNLFLKTIFKLKNKIWFIKINLKKHDQMNPIFMFEDCIFVYYLKKKKWEKYFFPSL